MVDALEPARHGTGRARGHGGIAAAAILWKRVDFRESSRVVTLLLREHGKVQALAKGAHRADSPLLGRLDFLNELQVRVSADRGGLRLLLRADLLRERRGLRAAARFLAASHFADQCDFGFPPERPDPALFDLLAGGLNLIERCPPAALAGVVLGLELRLLARFGALPDLDRCSACGRALDEGAFVAEGGGLCCHDDAPAPRTAISAPAVDALRTLRDAPGRQWPDLRLRLPPGAVALPGTWLAAALDHRAPLRARVYEAAREAAARAGGIGGNPAVDTPTGPQLR